ncbi:MULTISPECIES: hypothetical protein [unclassified Streptomyces]|uniref:hypothetical protein n=1 Tax=unclassified Streptomyces TaxID=2593676 RepID=UPI00344BE4A7
MDLSAAGSVRGQAGDTLVTGAFARIGALEFSQGLVARGYLGIGSPNTCESARTIRGIRNST